MTPTLHYVSGGTFFIEVQQPADLGILAEWSGFVDNEADAMGGLELDTALSCFDIAPQSREAALRQAFQQARLVRGASGARELALFEDCAAPFFDARRVDVDTTYEPGDGEYYVAIIIEGSGYVEGDNWKETVRKGDSLVFPASLDHRYAAGRAPLSIIRALGPTL
ncbi:MAG: hypothetical protein ACRDUT_02315 [Mycobacterium sp.]